MAARKTNGTMQKTLGDLHHEHEVIGQVIVLLQSALDVLQGGGKKRGRPKKIVAEATKLGRPKKTAAEPAKRGRPKKVISEPAKRGRPKKDAAEPAKRGRPKKVVAKGAKAAKMEQKKLAQKATGKRPVGRPKKIPTVD